GNAAIQFVLHADVILPLIFAAEIGVEVYGVDLAKSWIGIRTDIAISETVATRIASDRVVRLARGRWAIEPLNRLILQRHRIEVGHNSGSDGRVELANAGIQRGLLFDEYIVEYIDKRGTFLYAAITFNDHISN